MDLTAIQVLFDQKLDFKDFEIAMKYIVPQTHIIAPETIVTMDIRDDYSRFFPKYDNQMRVIGGSFQ